MTTNYIAILVAALVPTVVGFLWYGPLFGKAWMREANMTEEKMKGANMGIIFGVSILLSFMLAFYAQTLAIHQFNIPGLLMNEPGIDDPTSEAGQLLALFTGKYALTFRTFTHGMVHGVIASLFFILPVLGTNALFERKGWKYILLNVGYWSVTMAVMCGIISAWV